MRKPELGTKRRCNSCEAKFFDLNTDPIVCPKCLAVFIPPQAEPVRARRLPGGKPWPARKMEVPKVPNKFESLEETEVVDTETGTPAADPEGGDGDLILLDEQDDGKLDAPEIVGASLILKRMTLEAASRSMDVLQAYVRDADMFRDHAGAGLV